MSPVTVLALYDDKPSEALRLFLLGAWHRCLDTLHHRLGALLLILRVKLLLLLLLLYRFLLLIELEIGRRQRLSQIVYLRWWLVPGEEIYGGIGRQNVVAVGHTKV